MDKMTQTTATFNLHVGDNVTFETIALGGSRVAVAVRHDTHYAVGALFFYDAAEVDALLTSLLKARDLLAKEVSA